jgi:nitroreductase|uniref:nitroreductase family protein n=1 Tax=Candidatus Planktophila sp. TaxID=2175601 RepID=UPI0040492586
MQKKADTSVPIHPILESRWSPRAFDAQATVSAEEMTAFLEAARWAPSSYNFQPWRFIISRRGDVVFEKICEALSGFNQVWAPTASALIAVVVEQKTEGHIFPPIALFDAGLAVSQLTIEAHHRGFIVHQMIGFDKVKINNTFDISGQRDCIVILAVGRQGPAENLPEGPARDREVLPRERYPLSDLIIQGDL